MVAFGVIIAFISFAMVFKCINNDLNEELKEEEKKKKDLRPDSDWSEEENEN
jgi:hypothetical protein